MPCVYCGSQDDLTEEHVFPDVLGGGATVEDLVCRRCNNEFSRDFEQAFAGGFLLIRFLLGVRGRRGLVDALPAEVVVDGEVRPARVRAGEIAVHSFKVEEGELNGERRIMYRTFSQEAANALRTRANKRGWDLEEGPELLREMN